MRRYKRGHMLHKSANLVGDQFSYSMKVHNGKLVGDLSPEMVLTEKRECLLPVEKQFSGYKCYNIPVNAYEGEGKNIS